MKRLYTFFLSFLLVLPMLAEPTDTFTTVIRGRIDELLINDLFEHTQLGMYIYDLTADEILYDKGSRQCLRPASCEKVMTASSALSCLGGDYTYKTRLYIVAQTNEAMVGDSIVVDSLVRYNVYIKGGFDPMLGADDLKAFTQALSDKGITSIEGEIICDVSLKDTLSLGWGWCWDDGYGPLTPLLYQGKDSFRQHFTNALKAAGIAFNGMYRQGLVPHDASLLVTRTHTMDQILFPMMKKSNNMYAESLFYQMAAKSGKPYASYKDACAQVNKFVKLCGNDPEDIQIADGSGLSLYNYLSPKVLVDALRYVFHHEDIYNHLYPSLPIMGRDGTLRKRCVGTSAQDRVHAKTGTVEGVSTLAGYALAPNGHQLAFAIMNQGVRRSSYGKSFQDKICKALTQPLDLPTIEPDSISQPLEADSVPDELPESWDDHN